MLALVNLTSLIEFCQGFFGFVMNSTVFAAAWNSGTLRKGPQPFLVNLWVSNVILAFGLLVANVTDDARVSSMLKAEGSVIIINCLLGCTFVFLSLIYCFVQLRNGYEMSVKMCSGIVVLVWASTAFSTLAKAIVIAYGRVSVDQLIFTHYVIYEAATLLLLVVLVVAASAVIFYVVLIQRKPEAEDATPHQTNETEQLLRTLGVIFIPLCMAVFMYAVLEVSWLIWPSVSGGDTEVVVLLYAMHSLIEPVIYTLRDKNIRVNIKRMLSIHSRVHAVQETI